jgi:chorismate mutase
LEKVLSLRKKIDEIDEKILLSLKERIEVCKLIGKTKQSQGIPIRDVEREDEHYERIMKRAAELGLNPHEVEAIYEQIIAMGLHAQEPEATENH